MATCKHGETEPHGEIGKDWCAGPPRSWYFEAGWRRQLEDQMNLNIDMFTRFAEAQEIDGSQVPDDVNAPLRHQRLTDDELRTVRYLHEAMRGDERITYADHYIGTSPEAGLRYALTRYANVDTDSLKNFVPMGWIGWGEAHWYGDTPIYDTLVAERGDPRKN